MSKPTLILSPAFDSHAAAVTWGLGQCGLQALWSKSASLADPAIGLVSIHSEDGVMLHSLGGLEKGRFASVWARRPHRREEFPSAYPGDQAFIAQQWAQFQNNFLALHDFFLDALWVNSPGAAVRAENKLVQLQEASVCGLKVPPTLVSNDPDRIRQFIASHRKTIHKPLYGHGWRDPENGRVFDTPAVLIEDVNSLDDAAMALCPGIFQAYIDKTCDIRIAVIGAHIFAIRLDDGHGHAFVDWRTETRSQSLNAQLFQLPSALKSKLMALMGRLDLAFGAIDLVVDRAGDAHFLEINQSGQFLFMETWVKELPLLQAMCSMLAEGRANYSLTHCEGLNLAGYHASEMCAEWMNDFRSYWNEDTFLDALSLDPSKESVAK